MKTAGGLSKSPTQKPSPGALFILCIQRASAIDERVGFNLVNRKTGKLAKQSDAKEFGFFVVPEDGLDVLKLIGAQCERDNEKLATETAR